jgi:hypothetical protein
MIQTVEDYNLFKEAYNKALKNNVEEFLYQGQDILVSYAKYLLEYLEPKFGAKN